VLNRVWLGDITYVPTDEGWLYVAAMKDLCTRKIVGWAMRETPDAQIAVEALAMAVARQAPLPGLIVHTDRGGQYSAHVFTDALAAIGAVQSMSGTGNAYDNAPMESFFASLKGERLDHEHYRTRAEARAAVFSYIETFYNPVRMHSGIGY
jgi:transposase InsO family protein